MQSNNNQKNTLAAWSYSDDFVPTLYIQGGITTNNEKPVVQLKEKHPQGTVKEDLLLEFSPDVYDPNGKDLLTIQNFEKKINHPNEYNTATIISKNGNIVLDVDIRTH